MNRRGLCVGHDLGEARAGCELATTASPRVPGKTKGQRPRIAFLYAISRLYLHSLESFTQLGELIDAYVKEHNTRMPHHAFGGQTPNEVYFDQADRVRDLLPAASASGASGKKWRRTDVGLRLRVRTAFHSTIR